MMREGTVERAEAPELRQTSPLWKWAFIGVFALIAAVTLGAILLDEINKGEAPPAEPATEKKSSLRFNADFKLPTFAKPAPEPVAPAVGPAVPQLPPPETVYTQTAPSVIPPPVPVADAPAAQDPAEIAKQRRLKAALSGSVEGGTTVETHGSEARRDTGSVMDLTVTKTEGAVATRYQDLTFTIPKGTQIGCVLNTAIQSGQTGMVACTVPEDIYGADGTVVLLDRGSTAMGEYKTATLTYGKRRIYVVWSQVRTPEGVVIDIDSPGTGPLGRAGVGGKIDNHYWERVGIPMLMSIVSFGTQSYLRDELTSDTSRYVESIPDDTLGPVLGEMARIKPTLHKNQGEVVNIFVARDLDLSSVYQLRARR